MPTVTYTISQIEKMLINRTKDAGATLGVNDIVDPNKGYTIRTCWNHKDDDGKDSTSSEDFNPYRSYFKLEFDERF